MIGSFVSSDMADASPYEAEVPAGMSRSIPVLMYHHLVPDELGIAASGATIRVSEFERQMAYLDQNGYQTLFAGELAAYFKSGESLPEKTVVITFDDGYESNYHYAWPIMQKYGFKATISPIMATSVLEQQAEDAGSRGAYDPTSKRHLSLTQMDEMYQSGSVEFQSHTYNMHGNVTINSKGEQDIATANRAYLTKSSRYETYWQYRTRLTEDFTAVFEVLQTRYPAEVRAMFYPYGRYNDTILFAARRSGYQMGFITAPRAASLDRDSVYLIPRLNIVGEDDLDSFIKKLTQ